MASGSRQTAAPQASGPYRVFTSASYYETHSRQYGSPYPYSHSEPAHATPDASPIQRRAQRPGHHRRGVSSLSFSAPSGRYDHASSLPLPFARGEPEYAYSPPSYYDRFLSPPRVRSPEHSASSYDTLPPIWPENERSSRVESGHPSLGQLASSSAGLARQPSLLPTGLPPPQLLEPAPIWDHPHTNSRYMRPLPPSGGLSSLISELTRGGARSEPWTSPLLPVARPDRGFELDLPGNRSSMRPEAREGSPRTPEGSPSDSFTLRPYTRSASGPRELREASPEPVRYRPSPSRD